MPHANQPLPFISDHGLVVLKETSPHATREEQRRWLLPETFRWRRDDHRFNDAPAGLSDHWAWEKVPDREAFLADPAPRLRVITVNAGYGKTVVGWQTQYLLQQVHSDHLCLLVNFSRLPERCGKIWNEDPVRSMLVDSFFESEATKDAPRTEIARLIAQKIHAGKFTLIVEAFDQTTAGQSVQNQASALQKFLEINKTVRCVCTGRPHAIVDQFWKSLFVHDTWQFVQIDVFNKRQAEQFVGTDRWKLCQRLEATELFVPRSLEAIRNIPVDKLEGIRTASQVYWRSLLHTFEEDRITQNPETFSSPDGSWVMQKHHALQLFALLGFECNRQGFLDGVHSGEPFRGFLRNLWSRHETYLKEEFDLRNRLALEATLTTLARLNAAIDYAALDHDGMTQVIFQNRTLQDFFAAIWMCTHASEADVEWFSENRFVRWKKSTETFYQMWKLTTEMPAESEGQMIARIDAAFVNAVRVLFEPSTANSPSVRSTEMIWRSWPVLEEIGQQPTATGKVAREELALFQSEYGSILAGSRGEEAQRTCEEFETWFVSIDPHSAGWKIGDRDNDGNMLPTLDRPFQMAKFTVTNQLYAIFDDALIDRYREYQDSITKKGQLSQYSLRMRVPVVAVDWFDASCLAKWTGSVLPSELEWEYACRAGTKDGYAVGNGKELTVADARFDLNFDALPAEVDALYPGNKWGLYQMPGNVWEWCSDWYDEDQRSRSVRGGAFHLNPELCHSAFRYWFEPTYYYVNTGVRFCRPVADSPDQLFSPPSAIPVL